MSGQTSYRTSGQTTTVPTCKLLARYPPSFAFGIRVSATVPDGTQSAMKNRQTQNNNRSSGHLLVRFRYVCSLTNTCWLSVRTLIYSAHQLEAIRPDQGHTESPTPKSRSNAMRLLLLRPFLLDNIFGLYACRWCVRKKWKTNVRMVPHMQTTTNNGKSHNKLMREYCKTKCERGPREPNKRPNPLYEHIITECVCVYVWVGRNVCVLGARIEGSRGN